MDVGTALIISSVISLIGLLLWSERNNINWFKRKNFLFKQKVEGVKLKSLERQLNLKPTSLKEEKGLLENIKGLDLDKINDLISLVQKDEDVDEEEPTSITGIINNLIQNYVFINRK